MLLKPADRLKMSPWVWIYVILSPQTVRALLQNVALGKDVYQSSTHTSGGDPKRSVDGNVNQAWEGQSCSHTGYEWKPYLEIDLGKIYTISHIVVYNRIDAHVAHRTKHLRIEVSEGSNNYTTVCYHTSQIPDIYTCQPQHVTTGRLVKLTLDTDQNTWFHICEVEVMANIQLESEQSSKFKNIPSVKGTGTILQTSTEASSLACTFKCHLHTNCTGINVVYSTTHLECNLLASGYYSHTDDDNVSFLTLHE